VRRSISLSRANLDANLALVAATHGTDVVVDVRLDAYGHGALVVSERARAAGFTRFAHEGDETTDAEIAGIVYGTAGGAPVMAAHGEVVATKRLPAGSGISYGYTYRLERDTTVALVGLGYADGVPRLASSRGHVEIGGARRLVAGRIAMDQFMADLGDDSALPGDDVALWGGGGPTVGEWTATTGIPSLALTSGLGARFSREWVES